MTSQMKKVTEMTEAEFEAHIAKQHATLDRIERGVRELKSDYDRIGRGLAALLPN